MTSDNQLVNFTAARLLLQQFHFRGAVQIAGVAFVRIDVYFQLAGHVRPYEQVFQHELQPRDSIRKFMRSPLATS